MHLQLERYYKLGRNKGELHVAIHEKVHVDFISLRFMNMTKQSF